MQAAQFRLMTEGIDMRAGMLGHVDSTGGAGPCLWRSLFVVAMERVDIGRSMRWMDWRSKITWLLKVKRMCRRSNLHSKRLLFWKSLYLAGRNTLEIAHRSGK